VTNKFFGTLRAYLWPVQRGEYKKFIPMFLMCFLTCFNYYILRITKDALVVTSSGAEAIPFIKVWAILPIALLMTFIYTRFSNYLSRQKVFYAMIGFYIAYFTIFTLFLYPYRDSLHPHELADKIQAVLPEGFQGFIAMFRNWTYTSFYVMSEMWSTMIMTVLFWGFANDVTPLKDAKRFYGLFGVGTNSSGIVAGLVSGFLFSRGQNSCDQSVTSLNLIVICTSLVCMGLYWWLNRNGLGYTPEILAQHKESPIKMGIRKNFAYIAKSKYLIWIAILVVMFNITINLIEIVWKDQVKQLYPNASDFGSYMADINFWIGIIATGISLFFSGALIRSLGWTKSALISPIITLITGVLFFSCLLFPHNSILAVCASFGTTPLALAVFFGSLQNCFVRGTKYSLVDATKEISFIPLSQESKLKGKTAIDGVGSRLGKSGGSLMLQCLFLIFGSVAGSTPIVAFLLLIALGGWVFSVRSLGKQFNQLTAEHQTVSVPDEEKEPVKAQAASLLS
jgi:AAA family ATP:ADP antiporter